VAIGEAFLIPVARLLAEGRADGSIGRLGRRYEATQRPPIYGAGDRHRACTTCSPTSRSTPGASADIVVGPA